MSFPPTQIFFSCCSSTKLRRDVVFKNFPQLKQLLGFLWKFWKFLLYKQFANIFYFLMNERSSGKSFRLQNSSNIITKLMTVFVKTVSISAIGKLRGKLIYLLVDFTMKGCIHVRLKIYLTASKNDSHVFGRSSLGRLEYRCRQSKTDSGEKIPKMWRRWTFYFLIGNCKYNLC